MFLSVSIPIYNAEKRINECISSVMEQSEQDFELILVDDGSRDGGASICENWVEKYPEKIRFIQQENTGSLLARRRCLQESKGDYIYLMDADDKLIDKDAFKKVKEFITGHDCDLVIFNCIKDNETGKRYMNIPLPDREVLTGKNLEKVYEALLTDTCLNPLWNKVFSRKLVDWDTDYKNFGNVTMGEDLIRSIPIISSARRVAYLDEMLYSYTVEGNADSMIHTFTPDAYISMRTAYLRLKDYSQKWTHKPPNLDKLLKRAYMRTAAMAAVRVRLMNGKDHCNMKEYLASIGDDELFRQNYTLSLDGISYRRRIVLFLLFHRFYSLLSCILTLTS